MRTKKKTKTKRERLSELEGKLWASEFRNRDLLRQLDAERKPKGVRNIVERISVLADIALNLCDNADQLPGLAAIALVARATPLNAEVRTRLLQLLDQGLPTLPWVLHCALEDASGLGDYRVFQSLADLPGEEIASHPGTPAEVSLSDADAVKWVNQAIARHGRRARHQDILDALSVYRGKPKKGHRPKAGERQLPDAGDRRASLAELLRKMEERPPVDERLKQILSAKGRRTTKRAQLRGK